MARLAGAARGKARNCTAAILRWRAAAKGEDATRPSSKLPACSKCPAARFRIRRRTQLSVPFQPKICRQCGQDLKPGWMATRRIHSVRDACGSVLRPRPTWPDWAWGAALQPDRTPVRLQKMEAVVHSLTLSLALPSGCPETTNGVDSPFAGGRAAGIVHARGIGADLSGRSCAANHSHVSCTQGIRRWIRLGGRASLAPG